MRLLSAAHIIQAAKLWHDNIMHADGCPIVQAT